MFINVSFIICITIIISQQECRQLEGQSRSTWQPSHSHFLFIVTKDMTSVVKDKNSWVGQQKAQLLCFRKSPTTRGRVGTELAGKYKVWLGVGGAGDSSRGSVGEK